MNQHEDDLLRRIQPKDTALLHAALINQAAALVAMPTINHEGVTAYLATRQRVENLLCGTTLVKQQRNK